MKIVKEILYEKFTEDSDAIQDMGIGFVAKIKKAIKEIVNDSEFGLGSIISNISYINGKLICNTKFSIPSNAPYFQYIFSKHGMAEYMIFPAADTSHIFGTIQQNMNDSYEHIIQIKHRYKQYFKKALTLHEKFEEDSDPIKDLGIGKIDIHKHCKELKLKNDSLQLPREFLESLIGKTISGNFKRGFFETTSFYKFKIFSYVMAFGTDRIEFKDELGNYYVVLQHEAYHIS